MGITEEREFEGSSGSTVGKTIITNYDECYKAVKEKCDVIFMDADNIDYARKVLTGRAI